jgi:hypothetical protein
VKQRGFVGVQLYALAAIGIVVAGLSLTSYAFYYKAKAAEARVADVEGQRDRAIAIASANEEAAKRLQQLNEALNQAIVERDKRAKALEETRRKLRSELDELKRTLPAEDQSCLDRGLPQPLIDRLRDSPDGDGAKGRTPASPGVPLSPVSDLQPW